MADARMPDRYLVDKRFVRLDDEHFRSYVVALMWSVSNRTDGEILPGDLSFIPGFRAGSAPALVSAGLWSPQDDGWRITDYADTQTSRAEFEQLENARRRERDKKARQRARRTNDDGPGGDPVPGDVPGDKQGDVPPDHTGKARQGQARTGTDLTPPVQSTEVDHVESFFRRASAS